MQVLFVLFDHDLVVVRCGVAIDFHGDGRVGMSEYAAYFRNWCVHFQQVGRAGMAPAVDPFVDSCFFAYFLPPVPDCRIIFVLVFFGFEQELRFVFFFSFFQDLQCLFR